MLTPAELEILSRGLFPEDYVNTAPPPITPDEGLSVMGRIGLQTGNLASNTVNELIQDFIGFGQMFADESDRMSKEQVQAFKPVPQVFDIPQPTSTSDRVIDFIGGEIAPSLASTIIPYLGASKALKVAGFAAEGLPFLNAARGGITPVAREAIAQGFAGGLTGAQYGPEQMVAGTVLGTGGGVAEKLGRVKRLLPAIGMGAGEFVGQQMFGGMDTKEAALQATVGTLATMLPGKIKTGKLYDPDLHTADDLFNPGAYEGSRIGTEAERYVAGQQLAGRRVGELNPDTLVPYTAEQLELSGALSFQTGAYVPPFKSAQESANAMLEIPFERSPGRMDVDQQALMFDLPPPPRDAMMPPRQSLQLASDPRQMNLQDNWGVQARYNPLQLEHGDAQREFALANPLFTDTRFTTDFEPRVTPPAIDSRQMTLNSMRLKQVIEGRKPEWDAEKATLFDLNKYPITRNFELVEPARTTAGDARGGVPHFKNVDDPTQMQLEDLILRRAMQDLETPVVTAKAVEVIPPKPAFVDQQIKTPRVPKKVKLKSDRIGETVPTPSSTVVRANAQVVDDITGVEVAHAPGHKFTGEYTVKLPDGRTVTVLKSDEGRGPWILKPTEQGYEVLPGGVLTKEKGMAALKKAVLEHNKSGVFNTPKPAIEDILEKSFGIPKGSEKMSKMLKGLRSTEGGTVVQELLLSVGAGVATGTGTYAQTKDPVAALIVGLAAAGLAAGGLRKLAGPTVGKGLGKPLSVEGPALLKNGTIIRKGSIGEDHGQLKMKAVLEDLDETDAQHGFHDSAGNPLTREKAYLMAEERGQLNDAGIRKRALAEAKGEMPKLDSQDLLQTQIVGQQMKLGSREAGFIGSEGVSTLAGASIGAAVGYADDQTVDSAVGYALVGAGLGFIGIKALKQLKKHQGPTIKSPKVAKPLDETVKEKLKQFAISTSRTPGGIAVSGRGGMLPHSVRAAESWLGLNSSWFIRESKLRSEGLVSDQISQMQDAIDAAKSLKPSDTFIQKASLFLKGQLVPSAETVPILKAGGAVTQDQWEKMLPKDRAHLSERWVVKESATNTNTTGDKVEIWRTTNVTKTQLAELQRTHLERAAVTDDDKVFMALPIKAREVINVFQGVVLDAIPPGAAGRGLRDKLLGTFDQYQTRTFAMFTDPTFQPTEQAILNRMKRIATFEEDDFLKRATVSKVQLAGHQEVRPGVWIPNTEATAFRSLYDDGQLRSLVETEIKDYKRNKASFSKSMGESSDMDASLFGTRKELTEDLRELLGEHKNVTDEIVHTLNRLTGTTQAAKMISLMADAKLPNGLRLAYDQAEHLAAKNGLRHTISSSTDARVIREAQNKLIEMESYIPTKSDPRLGLFGDKWVSRFAHDQLKDYKSPWGIFESPMGRTISQANNIMKMVHAPYSPITQVRNLISVPAFLAMGRAGDPGSLKTAFNLLTNKSHPLWGRMRQLGIVNATQAKGEFKYGMHELVSGDADGKIMGLLRKGHKAVLDTYSKPDLFVRFATFLSAEKRLAKANPSWPKSKVESEALRFTDRRTMDYNNMPAAIKTIRQVPFVNMYISYAYEALRIMKNMAEDAAHGDIHAGATLAAVATIPFIIQAAAENALPPELKKKWDRTNKLGPNYSRTRFKVPTGRVDERGNMYYVDITPLNIIDNYAQMVRGAAKGDWSAVGATNPVVGWENTPMFTIMAAQITGRDLRSHRDFRGLDDRFTDVLRQTLPSFTPGIGYEAEKITPASLGGTFGITNLKTGRTDGFSTIVSKILTGANYTSINPGIVLSNAKKELDNEVRLEKQYLNDILKSTAPDEMKAKAIQISKEAIKVHMMDFFTKTNLSAS